MRIINGRPYVPLLREADGRIIYQSYLACSPLTWFLLVILLEGGVNLIQIYTWRLLEV
jgi:hypothetical protein